MKFVPNQLILARKRRGVTKATLSKETGISLRSINYYESGDVEPTLDNLERLSEFLRFPKSFFFMPEMPIASLASASFRSLSSMTASLRDSSLAAGALAIHFDKWIRSRFVTPATDLPYLSGLDPENAAESLREYWGLENKPIRNMVHLAEAKGIAVYSLPIDSVKVDAFSIWHSERPFIFLNSIKSGERSRMDVGHEIGHLVLHGQRIERGREAEHEADRFGAAFLMPASDVLAAVPREITLPIVLRLKSRWRVSAMALVYRLYSLGKITEWQYRSFCIELSGAGYRKSEPGGISKESSQILGKVFESLRSEGISRRSIADKLAISLSDLNSLIRGLAISPVSDDEIEYREQHDLPSNKWPELRLVPNVFNDKN